MSVTIDERNAVARFERFDLDAYELFLRCKKLPESRLTYRWQDDSYEIATPARFGSLLGDVAANEEEAAFPLAEHLFDYQRFIVERALEAKRYAVWADTGLGKTAMFLEWAQQVEQRTGARVLILSPLGRSSSRPAPSTASSTASTGSTRLEDARRARRVVRRARVRDRDLQLREDDRRHTRRAPDARRPRARRVVDPQVGRRHDQVEPDQVGARHRVQALVHGDAGAERHDGVRVAGGVPGEAAQRGRDPLDVLHARQARHVERQAARARGVLPLHGFVVDLPARPGRLRLRGHPATLPDPEIHEHDLADHGGAARADGAPARRAGPWPLRRASRHPRALEAVAARQGLPVRQG
jgi:hypothetical protein